MWLLKNRLNKNINTTFYLRSGDYEKIIAFSKINHVPRKKNTNKLILKKSASPVKLKKINLENWEIGTGEWQR